MHSSKEYSFTIKDKKKSTPSDDLNAKETYVGPKQFKNYGKIDGDKQLKYASEFCAKLKGKKLNAGEKTIDKQYFDDKERVWYSYQVGWQTGSDCASPKELDAEYPLGKDHKNNCESLMRFAY